MRRALVILLCFAAAPAAAWDSKNEADAEGPKAAQSRWRDPQNRDEHRQIWRTTLKLAAIPESADDDLELPTYTASSATWQPGSFLGAKYIQQRPHQPSEFAQLPDFSYSLWDWALGNETCPIDTSFGCHSFLLHMGAVNSNHFPPQSATFYGWYHGLALARAHSCAELATQLGPREDLRRYLLACESEALLIEAVAHHFLQDSWSMGHMWERWGGPDTSDYPLAGYPAALVVGAFTGLLHGARGVLLGKGFDDPNDAMCAPAEGVGYLDSGVSTPGQGDLYLSSLSPSSKQYGQMFACAVGSLRAVYEAAGQQHGAFLLGPLEVEPVDPAAEPALCFRQRATNRAIGIGYALDFIREGQQYHLTLEELASGLYVASSLLPQPISALIARISVEIIEIGTKIRLEAKERPLATSLAEGGIPSFLGSKPNGQYNHLASYVDPAPPWPGNDPHGKVLARQFHRAHAKDWCSLFSDGDPELDLNKLKARVAATTGEEQKVACNICSEFAQRHLRIGSDAAHYDATREPLCGLAGGKQFAYQRGRGIVDAALLARQWCGESDTFIEVVGDATLLSPPAQTRDTLSIGVGTDPHANPPWLSNVPVVVTLTGGGMPPQTINGVTDEHGWFTFDRPAGLSGGSMFVAATVPGHATAYRRLVVPPRGLTMYSGVWCYPDSVEVLAEGPHAWDYQIEAPGGGVCTAQLHFALGSVKMSGSAPPIAYAPITTWNSEAYSTVIDSIRIDSATRDGQPGMGVASFTTTQVGPAGGWLQIGTQPPVPLAPQAPVPFSFTYGQPIQLRLAPGGEVNCEDNSGFFVCTWCKDFNTPDCADFSFSGSFEWGGLSGLAPDARVTSDSGHDWEVPYGEWPRGSVCNGECPQGTKDCGTGCIDTSSDINNCGGCGTVCPPAFHRQAVCTAGSCGTACAPGYKDCNGACIAVTSCCSDGDCVSPANGSATCTDGACTTVCDVGKKPCMGACIDSTGCCAPSDCPQPANSTASCNNHVCGFACDASYKECNGACIAVAACCNCAPPPANASSTCNAGVCGFSCNNGFELCTGACVPTGNCCSCPPIQNGSGSCVGAACVITCDLGFTLCDNGETKSCIPNGGCCVKADCAGNPAGAQCVQHTCGCGAAIDCPAGNACNAATQACSSACVPGQACNGGCCNGTSCVDGTGDAACGTSGDCVDCTSSGGVCISGGCVPACSVGMLVVNEVFLGAGLTDWVELYNPCGSLVDLTGSKLVYRAPSDGVDTVLALLDGKTIAPNGYLLIANVNYVGTHDLGFITSLGFASSAGVALRDAGAQRVDSVEWGASSSNGLAEALEVSAPPATQSLARIPNGQDANDNHLDFQPRATPTPGAAN